MTIKVSYLTRSMDQGGIERVVSNLGDGFENTDIDFHIITNYIPKLSNYARFNINPLILKYRDEVSRNPFIIICTYIKCIYYYRHYLIQNNINIAMDEGRFNRLINYFGCIGTNIKCISNQHILPHTDPKGNKKYIKHACDSINKYVINKLVISRFSYIIPVSQCIKRRLIKSGIDENKLFQIYNPIKIQEIQDMGSILIPNDNFYNTEESVIVTVGRLEIEKGHVHLLRILRELQKDIKCRLAILGDGTLRPSLEKYASELNIDSNIKFYGWVENPFKYISQSSIYICSSLEESFGNSIIEAMACGCPVISTDCPCGPRELLSNGKYGILSSPFDSNYDVEKSFLGSTMPLTNEEMELKNHILDLLSDTSKQEYYSRVGLSRTMAFNQDSIIGQYVNLIRSLSH